MGKLTVFEIVLTNVGGICHAGGEVLGQVVVEVTKDLQVQELSVECDGRSQVFCIDTSKSTVIEGHPAIAIPHADEEVYICTSTILCGRQGKENGCLRKGRHVFDFTFHIPPHSPNSYEGEFGYVRYMLRARLKKSWEEENVTRKIRVIAKLDLNTISHVNEQIERSEEMTTSSLFSQQGVCHSALRLDRQGYVPGEIIPLSHIVHNNTARDMVVSLELRMLTEYRCQTITHTLKNRLQTIKYPKVAARSTFEQRENGLRVPACPPSHLHGCGIIHITYQVVLKVKPARLSLKRLRIAVTITIGTVPLRRGSLVTALVGNRPSERRWLTMPPPTYEEVMGMAAQKARSPLRADSPILTSLPDYEPLRARANTDSSIVKVQRR
ncbi:arrestin domain-containing protein 17-like [Gigantopelta aegis]|uniref:arrestin domain-containing protein 17-like n=1 Tax=Gigantopelta aegis TaxID=1735272 RepID=UPI001B88CC6D|nr:arrestin domain-containing protein 17-like [Gigantopelta aegis]